MCERWGIDTSAAQCNYGACQIEQLRTCRPEHLADFDERCGELPECAAGSVPEADAGGCWTGRCVPAHLCSVVKGCEDCGPNEVCHARVNTGSSVQVGPDQERDHIDRVVFHCMPVDPACPEATCECSTDPCRNGDCFEGSLSVGHPLYERSLGAVVCEEWDG